MTGGLLVGVSPFPDAFCSARARSLCFFSCLVSGLYLWASLNSCVAEIQDITNQLWPHRHGDMLFTLLLYSTINWYFKLRHQWSWWKCQHGYSASKYFTSFAVSKLSGASSTLKYYSVVLSQQNNIFMTFGYWTKTYQSGGPEPG